MKESVEIGQRLKDGWIVAGLSPYTHEVFSIQPLGAAEEQLVPWLNGQAHAIKLHHQGHPNARLPYLSELKTIFNNKSSLYYADLNHDSQAMNASDFERSGSFSGAYWSCTPGKNQDMIHVVHMGSGNVYRSHKRKGPNHYARCVRDEPELKLK